MSYAELLCRTNSSFLRGASQPSELVTRAGELELVALGITDRDGVYGIPKAYQTTKDLESSHRPTAKLIVGAELTLCNRLDDCDDTVRGAQFLPHLNLLAMNRAGYGLMCRLISESHLRGKGLAALDWERLREMLEEYPQGTQGLIAIPEPDLFGEKSFYEGLKDHFNERLVLPVCRRLDGKDRVRGESVRALALRLGVQVIATNDVHYHIPERRPLQDALTAIRDVKTLDEVGRGLFSNGERYLKSPAEMRRLFRHWPEAVDHTLWISERCTFSPSELRYRYPSEWIPAGETAQSHLEKLSWEGACRRFKVDRPSDVPADVRLQLEKELKLVSELVYADYFLTIWDVVRYAREKKILCQGRGSAANSVICYCLGVTAVDPVRMNLLFERFLSAERGEPPDIDVDFEHERREEVIQYIYEKYGRDRAGMVAAVITYRKRSCVRDLTRIGLGDQPELMEALRSQLKGFPRHLSIHSGGFTLSADPIIETVPIEPARMEGRTIVQWDKDDLAAIGLLKVDILSLGMLSAIRKTLDLTGHTLESVPAEDAKTYAMIQKAETVGVFQIESRAQMSMLGRLLPKNFYDLVVEVAIVRPGPIQGQMVHPYLRRRRGLEPATSPDPRLEPILKRTLGVPLFQEQVMKIAMVMAGFTAGEADQLRRVIGAWKSEESLHEASPIGRKLWQGLLASGLSQDYVERIFQQIKGFSEYGFPESHAASFALLAYVSSYLKCHHPGEFACALINSQPMGFYANHTLVDDAKRAGVVVLPVDPHYSDWDCTMEAHASGRALRLGWKIVKGAVRTDVDALIAERERSQFKNLENFLSRTRLSLRALTSLALGDAFQSLTGGASQREVLWRLLAQRASRLPVGAQLSLFGAREPGLEAAELVNSVAGAPLPLHLAMMSRYDQVQAEYRAYSLSTRAHPMTVLREKLPLLPRHTSASVKTLNTGVHVRVAGLIIVRQHPMTAKGTEFATLEDEHGLLDLIVHKKISEQYEEIFYNEPFVVIVGKLQRDTNTVNVIVQRFERLAPESVWDSGISSHDWH